ncbi:DUF1269 domain-containing protein [Anaerolineales bacterium]
MSEIRNTLYKLVFVSFPDHSAAHNSLEYLKQIQHQHQLKIEDVAIIERDSDGQLKIQELQDIGGIKGAGIGSISGAVVGMIAGPLGMVFGAVAGAITGGLTAHFFDAGIPDDDLHLAAEALANNTSALIILLPEENTLQLLEAFSLKGVKVVEMTLNKTTSEKVTEAVKRNS